MGGADDPAPGKGGAVARRRPSRSRLQPDLGSDDHEDAASSDNLLEVACAQLPLISGDDEGSPWRTERLIKSRPISAPPSRHVDNNFSSGSSGPRSSSRFDPPERRPDALTARAAWESEGGASSKDEPSELRTAERPRSAHEPVGDEQLTERDEYGNYLPLIRRARRKYQTEPNASEREEQAASSSSARADLRRFKASVRGRGAEAAREAPERAGAAPGEEGSKEEASGDSLLGALQALPKAQASEQEDPLRDSRHLDEEDSHGRQGYFTLSCGDLPVMNVVHRPQRRIKTVHVTAPAMLPSAPPGGRPRRPEPRRPRAVTFVSDGRPAPTGRHDGSSAELTSSGCAVLSESSEAAAAAPAA